MQEVVQAIEDEEKKELRREVRQLLPRMIVM
jgi:hypothetical protein